MTPKASTRRRIRPARTRAGKPGFYLLKLYIAGLSPRSVTAIRSIKRICEKHLANHYKLEIVDLYRQPARAKEEQIVAAPTLIKKLPAPLRRLIGSLSDESRVIAGLNVKGS
jgi:circadian clock protein KaiB